MSRRRVQLVVLCEDAQHEAFARRPRRNIETWIAYLKGEEVDESSEYPKLERERECGPAVDMLKEMCDKQSLRMPAPESLQRACGEYRERIVVD